MVVIKRYKFKIIWGETSINKLQYSVTQVIQHYFPQIVRLSVTDRDIDEANRIPVTYAIVSLSPSTSDIIIDRKFICMQLQV